MPAAVIRPARIFLVLALVLSSSSCGLFCRPRPSVTAISPSSAVAGGPQFFLTVSGRDFRFDSFVTWNGGFRPTAFISTNQLLALINTGDIALPGANQIRVFTPPGDTDVTAFSTPGAIVIDTRCGGGNSNVITLTVTARP